MTPREWTYMVFVAMFKQFKIIYFSDENITGAIFPIYISL